MKIKTRQELRKAVTDPEKILVYQFGGTPTAGFCADYWHFLNRLIKCLYFGIGFRFGVVVHPRGFITQKGYCDYFEPFCEEVYSPLLDLLNVWQFPFARKVPIVQPFARFCLKKTCRPKADYFMFDKLEEIHSLGPPVFDRNQSVISACRDLMRILWVYNSSTEEALRPLVQDLKLPKDYNAIMVRRGDKYKESPYVEFERYAEKLRNLDCENRTVFIATDDYRVISLAAKALKQYKLFTLTEPESLGYDNERFRSLPAYERRRRTIRFLAKMEIMRDARYCLGTATSSISWVVNCLRSGKDMILVD